jgi:endo-1,4-beta-D-glucanase Y
LWNEDYEALNPSYSVTAAVGLLDVKFVEGAWKANCTLEAGAREQFVAAVSSRGSTDDQVKFNQTETALALGMLKYRRRHTKAQREAS